MIPPIYALVVGAHREDDRASGRRSSSRFIRPLAGLAFGDFHENGFAPAAVAWMLWAFDCGRIIPAAIFALCAIAVKEDQAIFVGIAAAAGAWRFRRHVAAVASRLAWRSSRVIAVVRVLS